MNLRLPSAEKWRMKYEHFCEYVLHICGIIATFAFEITTFILRKVMQLFMKRHSDVVTQCVLNLVGGVYIAAMHFLMN